MSRRRYLLPLWKLNVDIGALGVQASLGPGVTVDVAAAVAVRVSTSAETVAEASKQLQALLTSVL